ncbi:hypothetical protein BDU57DRAFT_49992 [Ampelomyces quisqualis]|uniref:Uncharacterized protein n=1 Tax=Ampelomyces quisqualis TaxID=50730 RepID=A0A6A5R699_AMPQU|nr:hypothetical protein BDU57DRAFT_49992 [Ampelomyces quisqualis]
MRSMHRLYRRAGVAWTTASTGQSNSGILTALSGLCATTGLQEEGSSADTATWCKRCRQKNGWTAGRPHRESCESCALRGARSSDACACVVACWQLCRKPRRRTCYVEDVEQDSSNGQGNRKGRG